MRQTGKHRKNEGSIPIGRGKFKPDKLPGRDGRRQSKTSRYHDSVLSMKQESSNIHDERTSGPGRQRQTTPFRLSRKFLAGKAQTLIFPEGCEILTAYLEY
jgi:hypothetical protein